MFFERLQSQTQAERQAFLAIPLIQRALAGEVSRDLYQAFLVQAYHHVKHTVPLLMACGSRLPERLEWLREAICEYIEEEVGHQEWILDDIASLGGDKERVRQGQPLLSTELMVAYAYDGIQRRNPVSFFGMVQVLEGMSVALATKAADQLQQSLELPPQALRYLRSHGALDQEHVQFFARLMNRLDDPVDQAAVLHAAQVFYRLYGDIFRALEVRV